MGQHKGCPYTSLPGPRVGAAFMLPACPSCPLLLLREVDQLGNGAAYWHALKLAVLREDARWHAVGGPHGDVCGDAGVGDDREAVALEQHGQHHFHLLRGKACPDAHMASRAERQVFVGRAIKRGPALRLETGRFDEKV